MRVIVCVLETVTLRRPKPLDGLLRYWGRIYCRHIRRRFVITFSVLTSKHVLLLFVPTPQGVNNQNISFFFFFPPMPPHILFVDFVVLPPGHGRSVTDF